MTVVPTPLIAGNWKMNGLASSLDELTLLADELHRSELNVDMLICPPATLLWRAVQIAQGSSIRIGGQDCHFRLSGAHTGDISAEMLRDAGASYVILGHSERRADHGETDARVAAKSTAAQAVGLTAIICLGETLAERDDGRTIEVVSRQLAGSIPADCDPLKMVIAYEPVWAIGTGRTPCPDDVAIVHGEIRSDLEGKFGTAGAEIRILYGGSVKPENAQELLTISHVNGALVGGASLKADDFTKIIYSAAALY